jgi:hypothetical protein
MNAKYAVMLVVGILIGIAMQAVFAKGEARVTISGGDLPQEIEILEDECVKNALSVWNLADNDYPVRSAPTNLEGEGYLITRYDELNSGEYQPFDQMRFYFDPMGGRGYVYYEAIADPEFDMDGNWYRPTEQSQFVIEYLLDRARARLPLPN